MNQGTCFFSNACETLPMHPDYRLMPQKNAAIVFAGLFVGAASQGLAYAIMWDDDTVRNMVTLQYGLFCLLWTTWTVGLNVLVGWNMARCDQACDTGSTTNPQQQRTMMRMESMYFAGTILGIWLSWVGIDVLRNDTERAVQRLILLYLSIISYAIILHCFPEESCVEDPASEVGQGNYVPPQLLLAAQTV
jgi:hypothetical protein